TRAALVGADGAFRVVGVATAAVLVERKDRTYESAELSPDGAVAVGVDDRRAALFIPVAGGAPHVLAGADRVVGTPFLCRAAGPRVAAPPARRCARARATRPASSRSPSRRPATRSCPPAASTRGPGPRAPRRSRCAGTAGSSSASRPAATAPGSRPPRSTGRS